MLLEPSCFRGSLSIGAKLRHGSRSAIGSQVSGAIIFETHLNVSILFRPKNRVRAKIFRSFRESFSNFSPARKFFRRPKIFQNLADSAAIRLVQKSSKSEPSSPFFGRLKFRGKFGLYKLLQNVLCGYKIEMAN